MRDGPNKFLIGRLQGLLAGALIVLFPEAAYLHFPAWSPILILPAIAFLCLFLTTEVHE